MWHELTTVARQTPRDMFSMWSDPSLLRNNGRNCCSLCGLVRHSSGCFLCGPFPGYITRTSAGSLGQYRRESSGSLQRRASEESWVSRRSWALARYSAELVAVEDRLRSRCQPCVVVCCSVVKCIYCNTL
jgi:hypothetical protein